MREKRASITEEDVAAILDKGGAKAREVSEAKMREVRKAVGVA
jgi:hypothetical protein